MKTKIKVDKDTYLKGFRLTFENAKRLFDAAAILEEKKEFAIANSLLILSAEEGVKAVIILLQHLYYKKTLKHFDKSYFDKFFIDHKHKHEVLRSFTGLYQIFKKYGELYANPIIENIIEPKEDKRELQEKSFQNFYNWFENEAKSNKTELAKQDVWWNCAETKRKDGFYVSYKKGIWQHPSLIKKQEYLKSKKYVDEFLCPIEWVYNNYTSFLRLISEMKNEINTQKKKK